MRSFLLPTVLTLLLSMGVTVQAKQIFDTPELQTSPTKNPKPKRTKGSSASRVTFHNGSEESRYERDRRLKRECKGRSNSGVCEGYTR